MTSAERHSIAPVVVEGLRGLDEISVFFGHQSVGMNILDGIRDLAGSAEVDIRITPLDSGEGKTDTGGNPGGAGTSAGRHGGNGGFGGGAGASVGGGIVEAAIGRNRFPEEKVADFARMMRSGLGDDADIALMKFCYTDSGHAMSAEEIFRTYIEEMERLEAEYPDTTIAYVTMPLMAPRRSLKNLVKNVLGMDIWGREDNIEREHFNELLRSAKADSGRLFDLAAVESTRPDSTVQTFTHDGEAYRSLVSEYTEDGGHVNETGRRVVAEEFVLFLGRFQRRRL